MKKKKRSMEEKRVDGKCQRAKMSEKEKFFLFFLYLFIIMINEKD